jgi:hypothetical protein
MMRRVGHHSKRGPGLWPIRTEVALHTLVISAGKCLAIIAPGPLGPLGPPPSETRWLDFTPGNGD